MFKRKKPLGWKEKLQNWVWPQIGWRKYGRYMALRLSRLGGSPRSIAAGVACGVAISFTPFVGFHFLLAAITAWIVRGNIVASALGTAAGNPWTFPFIWLSVLYSGRAMLGMHETAKVAFLPMFEKAMHAVMTLDFSLFAREVWPIFLPMLAGCIPFYIVSWLVSYYLVKQALVGIAEMRNNRRQKAAKRLKI